MYVKLILTFLYLSETICLHTVLRKAWTGPVFPIMVMFVWSAEINNYSAKTNLKYSQLLGEIYLSVSSKQNPKFWAESFNQLSMYLCL